MKCRMCGKKNLKIFLDLGNMPLVDRFLSRKELRKKEPRYPLKTCVCMSCGLVQLTHVVPPNRMYNSKYAYESSTTKLRTRIYFKMAKDICRRFKLDKKSLVIDIGSNVGLLLSGFKKEGTRVVGIEPSSNVAKIANRNGIKTINNFFGDKIVSKIIREYGMASVITATNVFAHINDLDSFMITCKKLLDYDGVFIFQAPYLLHLLENNEYDTIYHEHLSYISVKPLIRFFEKHGMDLFDINEIDIDGGSLRCFINRKGARPISSKVREFIELEEEKGIHSLKRLEEFSNDVKKQRKSLLQTLNGLKKQNKRIVGLSAPAKGIIMLNFCNIDNKILDYVTEKSILKIGKYTPGTHIKVLSDDYLIQDKPDYALILAWNFAEEIMNNLKKYRKSGGRFIIPIPKPRIV